MDCPYHTHCLYTPKNISVGVLEWDSWTFMSNTHTVHIQEWDCWTLDCPYTETKKHLCGSAFWVYTRQCVNGMDSPFMSNNPIQALPQTCLWECLNGTVGHKWTVHTTHTVYIHPKTCLWECLNGTDKWTVHTTHTVYIYPKPSLWECLNGIVGHKWTPYHTHCLYIPKNISVGVLEWDINGLSIHTHFKHSHRHVFGSVYRQCVWYGQSIYVQQPIQALPQRCLWECLNGSVLDIWTVHFCIPTTSP